MYFEDDPFDDSPPKPKPARAGGGRFKPKASSKTTANQRDTTTNDSTQVAGSAHVIGDPTSSNVGTDVALQPKAKPKVGETFTASKEESSIPASIDAAESAVDELTDPTLLNSSEQIPVDDGLDSEVVVPVGCQDSVFSHEESGPENADMFSTLEYLDDMQTQTTGQEVGAATDSRHKVDLDAEHIGNCVVQTQTSVDSAFNVTESIHEFETQDIEPEGAIASGRRARKCQPKPKAKSGKKKATTASHPSQTEYMEEYLTSGITPNTVYDYSSLNLSHFVPPNPTSTELPMTEDVSIIGEISQENLTVSGGVQTAPEIAEPSTNFSMHDEEDNNNGDKVITKSSKKKRAQRKSIKPVTDNEKSVKKRKKADKTQDQAKQEPRKKFSHSTCRNNVSGGVQTAPAIAEPSTNFSMHDEEDNNNGDEVITKSSKKKRAQRKSKKPVTDNEKSVKKRKKADKTQDQAKQEPQKKFSHSTRRNKRTVDKALLLTPDDEIDFQRIPIKDLILLAEYKERIAKKEEKSKPPVAANQSNDVEENNSFREEDYDRVNHDSEDDRFSLEQNDDFNDNQASCKTQPMSSYFNYQSYMNKAPRSRWSKQETELFYEAVGQFGTDFSMIQQLFPERTRHQVKLKYKKEQRQQPLRLCEAETSRSKDYSHFEKLIEQLRQTAAAAQAELDEAHEEDSIYIAGDEGDEVATEVNEEVAKPEADENEADAKDAVADAGDVNNLSKPAEDEDEYEDDSWDTYKIDY